MPTPLMTGEGGSDTQSITANAERVSKASVTRLGLTGIQCGELLLKGP